MFIEADGHRLPIREGLAEQIEEAWRRLSHAATWWSGAERVAIAARASAINGCFY